ncbi:helix-turn-helix domain-containing protein [Algoriphagus marinus]|uniref:helix-turn-helix domain-containing protein n=1 Tax=Algoriphagus marinus TaxID=1925762 RepID=UPI0015880717|nr:helix-turn-helix domain-containing protein [Algoriphagus marinus]
MKQKVKTRQQVADEYGISARTLSRWFQNKKLRIPKGLLSPKVQELIYQEFGKPIS